jgi:hypothetical protein
MDLERINNDIIIINDKLKIGEIEELKNDLLTIEIRLSLTEESLLDKTILFLIKRLKNKMYKNVIINYKPKIFSVSEIAATRKSIAVYKKEKYLIEKIKYFLELLLQYSLKEINIKDDNIVMDINLNFLSNKNVKVMPLWFGPRRKWERYTTDYKQEFLKMFEFVINKEIDLDKGMICDTIFYINNPFDEILSKEVESIKKYVYSFNNKITKNGKIMVFERPNFGISYGAFSQAFNDFFREYDFWFFTEDDNIIIKENYILNNYNLFKKIDNNIGYIADSGVCPNFPNSPYPSHVNFGCGFTSKNILNECRNTFGVLAECNLEKDGADTQHLTSEIPFTNNIYKLGYSLKDSDNLSCTLEWRGYDWKNVQKMVAFEEKYLS